MTANRPYFFEHDIHLMAEAALGSSNEHAVEYTEAMFEEAMVLFPDNAFLILSFAAFVIHYKHDLYRAMGLLNVARRVGTPIGMRLVNFETEPHSTRVLESCMDKSPNAG